MKQQEKGFGAIAAIVVLVLLASLGGFIARISSLRSVSTAMDVTGSLALQAARSGIEWQMWLILNPENTSGTVYVCAGSPGATRSTNVNFGGALAAFTVTVTCTEPTPTAEDNTTIRIYQIKANACNIPSGVSCPNGTAGNTSIGYVERQVSAATETCRAPSGNPC